VLYDRHYLPVFHFVQRVLRGGSDAEDIAQETFLTASRIAGTFDGRASCRPWLYGIAARLMLHRGRRAARLARFLSRLVAQPSEPALASPHELLMRSEAQDELSRALAKLSPEKRMVLVLAEVEGLPCEEIARALDIPLGTVWTRLHHARKALKKQLAWSRS
jgi:RNA polymerase sigma-70 factor (ECF subfamily)